MKVFGSYNKKVCEINKFYPKFNFWLHVILHNVHGSFLSCMEILVKTLNNFQLVFLKNKILQSFCMLHRKCIDFLQIASKNF